MKKLNTGLACMLLLVSLAACSTSHPSDKTTQQTLVSPAPDTSLSIDERIRESFRVLEPAARREQVLQVTQSYLRYAVANDLDNETASLQYTEAAFASERLTFSDPAFIRRHENWAVIGLPDGLGLYFFDLNADPGTAPLQVSVWTIGLRSVEVVWRQQEFGVSYTTIGQDDFTRLHFALVNHVQDNWHVSWFSDEDPDWWFNVFDARLGVDSELSQLNVVGKAFNTTKTFYEADGKLPFPYREFRVQWERLPDDNTFVRVSDEAMFPHQQAWLWAAAEPSAYATLVEFIERLRMTPETQTDALLPLVADQEVIDAARSFGLYLADRQFVLSVYDDTRYVFRDTRGAFVATFTSRGREWVIQSIAPLGSEDTGS